jgi:Ca2+-binding EF-hand superfamily protein
MSHTDQSKTKSKQCSSVLKAFDDLQVLLLDQSTYDKLWSVLDANGNGIVSLAEIDNLAVYTYPILNHKPALMRAYKKTTANSDQGSTDEFVHKEDFQQLINNLFWYNRIYYTFSQIDADGDHRLSKDEFIYSFSLLKLSSSYKAKDVFETIDVNQGGVILFDEFCAWFDARVRV